MSTQLYSEDQQAISQHVTGQQPPRQQGGGRTWLRIWAVVIGTAGRHIPKERAMEHIHSYTVLNDVSARDIQHQYADHEGGLGMIDVVLTSLMHRTGTRSELASERDPYPEY